MGLTNADNAFTLYYVKFRAAAPKVRVSILIMTSSITFKKYIITFFINIFCLQSLIEQIEQRAKTIPE